MREWTILLVMYYCCLCQYIGYAYSLLLAIFFDFFPSKRIPSKKKPAQMPATPAGRRAAWRSGGSCPEDVNRSEPPPMTGGSVAGAAVSAAARKIQARVYHSESMLVRHMLANP